MSGVLGSSIPLEVSRARAAAVSCTFDVSKVRFARIGIDSSERLGRHRWVVERIFAWSNRNRRFLAHAVVAHDLLDRFAAATP